MKILIVCASILEADFFISEYSSTYSMKKVLTGYYFEPENNTNPHILVTGIGKTNSSLILTHFINNEFKPDEIINSGIAGAFSKTNVSIGDVAVANEEIYGDEGVLTENGFKTLKNLNFPVLTIGNTHYYNSFPVKIKPNLIKMIQTMTKIEIIEGKFVTISECTGTEKRKEEMVKRFNPLCESMEGAAILHTCIAFDIPFIEFRGISNYTGSYDKTRWDVNKAMSAVVKVVKAYIDLKEIKR